MDVKVNKGYNIKLAGKCLEEIAELSTDRVAYTLSNFSYLKPKVLLQEGDTVKKGTPIMCDKKNPSIVFVSPVAGQIESISRGDRRVLLHVIIKKSGEEAESFEKFDDQQIKSLNQESAKEVLCSRGLWPYINRRPYHKIAELNDQPNSIFISALDSNPLSASPSFYLNDRAEDFQTGVEILKHFSQNVHICIDNDQKGQHFSAPGANIHSFSGKHPKGNLSVHIDNIDPVINSDKIIWSLRAQEVIAIGKTLRTGEFDAERIIAWAGPGAEERKYYRTVLGASTKNLPVEEGNIRRISGNVLSGYTLDENAFLGFFDNTIIALKEGNERSFLGWLVPGSKSHSMTKCYLSSLTNPSEYHMTTTTNGEHRAIVDSEMFDRVQPLDIHTIFLYKALLAGDVEEAERQGLWSVAPEDFALASYMDPSKNDFGAALQSILDMLYKEESLQHD